MGMLKNILAQNKALKLACFALACLFVAITFSSDASAQIVGYNPGLYTNQPVSYPAPAFRKKEMEATYKKGDIEDYKRVYKAYIDAYNEGIRFRKEYGVDRSNSWVIDKDNKYAEDYRQKIKKKMTEAGHPDDYIAWQAAAKKAHLAYTEYTAFTSEFRRDGSLRSGTPSNRSCQIPLMREKYQSTCYSCLIVKTLIETFANACAKVYGVARDAGVKILFLGTILWLAFFALRNVSSMANIEPGDEVNELLKQLFKVVFVYFVLQTGLGVIVDFIINPLLATGADYGLGILKAMSKELPIAIEIDGEIIGSFKTTTDAEGNEIASALDVGKDIPVSRYEYTGSSVLSPDVINKLVALNMAIDSTVSLNMVIGNALMCHASHAGLITLYNGILGTVRILDFWIWLVGAIIWVVGFLMSIAVSYYLLDVSFKIGLAIMILPVVIALWPFSITAGKLKKTVTLITSSAATFAFLAITCSYAVSLFSAAFQGTNQLLEAIEKDDVVYIDKTFAITGNYFLIIVFALIYGFLLVGKTITDYSSKFFADGVTGGSSPMHQKTTQATMAVKKGFDKTAKLGGEIVGNKVGKPLMNAYKKGANKLGGGAKNLAKKAFSKLKR